MKRRDNVSHEYYWKGTIITPAVLISTSGGMGNEADKLILRMAERMRLKRGAESFSSMASFMRRRFRFDLLKTCKIALRGYKMPATSVYT